MHWYFGVTQPVRQFNMSATSIIISFLPTKQKACWSSFEKCNEKCGLELWWRDETWHTDRTDHVEVAWNVTSLTHHTTRLWSIWPLFLKEPEAYIPRILKKIPRQAYSISFSPKFSKFRNKYSEVMIKFILLRWTPRYYHEYHSFNIHSPAFTIYFSQSFWKLRNIFRSDD